MTDSNLVTFSIKSPSGPFFPFKRGSRLLIELHVRRMRLGVFAHGNDFAKLNCQSSRIWSLEDSRKIKLDLLVHDMQTGV
jgi:hypothetical protein